MLIGVLDFCGIFGVLWDIYYWFILNFWGVWDFLGWMGWDWVLGVGWGVWDGLGFGVGICWRLGILVLDIILGLEDF